MREHPIRSALYGILLVLTFIVSVFWLGVLGSLAQLTGLAAFLMARESATFAEHRHIIAAASIACVLAALQQCMMIMLGGDIQSYIPGAIMLGHAAITTTAFAILPDSKTRLRIMVALGLGVVGSIAAGLVSMIYQYEYGYLLVATTIINALLFVIPDKHTPKARFGYILMNALHFLYWSTQPILPYGLMLTELMYLVSHPITLAEHDVPMRDRISGRIFTSQERRVAYFKWVLWKGVRATWIGPTRADIGWVRPDNRCYIKVWRWVTGI